MKKIIKTFKELNESSLSRIVKHMSEHDCGIMTAERKGEGCKPTKLEYYTKKQNYQRNRQLNAKLQILGYGITKGKGVYIENYKSKDLSERSNVYEDVYFIVDLKDNGNLKNDLLELGELYMQDSIFWIPKPGNMSYLIGTNHCEDAFPGYGIVSENPIRSFGVDGEFMTMINGRPFKFTQNNIYEDVYNNYDNTNYLGKMGTKNISNINWKDIKI